MTFLVLFNGLWQGALLTGAAIVVSRMLPARDATTRYALWLTTLCAIAVTPVVTTLVRAPFGFPTFTANAVTAQRVSISLVALSTHAADRGMHFAAFVSWLVALWASCAAFNLCRLFYGYVRLAAIARKAQPASNGTLGHEVFVSDDVDVPLVAGIVHPRILIPVGMQKTLDIADLQRVIAHERAHVRRNDPWFNLAIRTIQALLFFNPAIYFVIRRLAEEREAACDDVAISESGQSFDYAACLAAIAQMQPRRIEVMSQTALGFRTSLLSRIERLQSAQPRITIINRKVFGGIVMLFAIIALALQTLTPALALTAPVEQNASQPSTLVAASCAQPNVEASVLTPAPPTVPHRLSRPVSAQAVVTIAPTGHVANVRILRTSGDASIDNAVLAAARHSSYRAKMVDCVAVQGSYVFKADFAP